jgi:hypothetical protein
MPGDAGVTCGDLLVCFFHFAREATGASRARHSLRPSILREQKGENFAQNMRRDRGGVFE